MTMKSLTTEAERELLSRTVDYLAGPGRFPVVFAGFTDGAAVPITEVAGASAENLRSLRILPGYGLGGKAINSRRPEFSRDYGRDLFITHHYDGAVLGENIVSLFAAPVLHGDQLIAVVYGGFRQKLLSVDEAGDRISDAASWFSHRLGRLARKAPADEPRVNGGGRKAIPEAPASSQPSAQTLGKPSAQTLGNSQPDRLDGAHRELLRTVFAELRSIRAGLHDQGSTQRIQALEERLAEVLDSSSAGVPREHSEPKVRLAPRELDVLANVALGMSNAAVAAMLGLKESTVKSYLNSAMAKLDADTRHSAVTIARRLGALP